MVSLSEGHVSDFLLSFPDAILERVEDHFVPEIKTRVNVESNITSIDVTTLQIDMEPVGGSVEGQNYLLPSNINTDKVINIPSLCNRPCSHYVYRNQDKNLSLSAVY